MKKNKILSSILVSALLCSAAFSGCSLVTTNNKADMEQVIATVNISQSSAMENDSLNSYKEAVTASNVLKRDLVSAYLNVGSTYAQYGMSGEQIVDMLVNSLVNTEVISQYAVLNLLKDKVDNGESNALEQYLAKETEKDKYEYLLSAEEIDEVKYNFFKTLNTSLDSYEKQFIEEETNEQRGTETRTTPGNVDTETENFYPKKDGTLNYFVYTGYSGFGQSDFFGVGGDYTLQNSGDYLENESYLEDTNESSRKKAYNRFLNSLNSNYLLTEDDNPSDILSLKYVKDQYVLQLKTAVTNKYYELYEAQVKAKILPEDGSAPDVSYIQTRYDSLFEQQKASYTSASAFETAMGSMGDSSFILYSPSAVDGFAPDEDGNYNTYGYVYNILLPFSNRQNAVLSGLQSERTASNNGKQSENEYFAARNALLGQIETVDQRSAWFNGKTEYAYDASATVSDYYGKDEGRDYLFFENNLKNSDRYEALKNYDGRYAYNGRVAENEDGSYLLLPEKVSIDGMLDELESYVNYVVGSDVVTIETNANYYAETDFYKDGSDKEVDYSKFVYATGSVDFGADFNRNNLFYNVDDSVQYKAMSAINELQYAYTTDTAVLSEYVGYSVGAGATQFIKEFEYATQEAIKNGPGSIAVCAGDYGWHLIYVTYTFNFEGGAVYNTPDWSKIEEEGTFENLFYEYVKSSDLGTAETGLRTTLIQNFSGDESVTHYEDRYQDLVNSLS
ncbi:MAG: hypothetical protein E7370_00480 [Clostridiales bacterium]|nr:hypothetical protein [Clostridiales bacterium]